MFGGGICRNVAATYPASNRGDIDDAAITLLYQCWHKGFGHVVYAGEVNGQHALPEFIGVVQKLMASRVPCVVDKDIDSAQPSDQGFCHVLYLFAVGDIAEDRQALAAHRLYLSNERLEFGVCAGAHRHISARLGKGQRDTATYAPASARYHCPPPRERKII